MEGLTLSSLTRTGAPQERGLSVFGPGDVSQRVQSLPGSFFFFFFFSFFLPLSVSFLLSFFRSLFCFSVLLWSQFANGVLILFSMGSLARAQSCVKVEVAVLGPPSLISLRFLWT